MGAGNSTPSENQQQINTTGAGSNVAPKKRSMTRRGSVNGSRNSSRNSSRNDSRRTNTRTNTRANGMTNGMTNTRPNTRANGMTTGLVMENVKSAVEIKPVKSAQEIQAEEDRISEYKAIKEANKKFIGIVIDGNDLEPLSPNEVQHFQSEYNKRKWVSTLNQGRYIEYLNERLAEFPEDDDLRMFGAMISSFEASYREGHTRPEIIINKNTNKIYSEYVKYRYMQTGYIPKGMTIVTDPSKGIRVVGTRPSPWNIFNKEEGFPSGLAIMVILRDGRRHIYIGSSTDDVTPYHLIQRYRRGTGEFPEKTNYTIVYPSGKFIRLTLRESGTSFSEKRGTWQ